MNLSPRASPPESERDSLRGQWGRGFMRGKSPLAKSRSASTIQDVLKQDFPVASVVAPPVRPQPTLNRTSTTYNQNLPSWHKVGAVVGPPGIFSQSPGGEDIYVACNQTSRMNPPLQMPHTLRNEAYRQPESHVTGEASAVRDEGPGSQPEVAPETRDKGQRPSKQASVYAAYNARRSLPSQFGSKRQSSPLGSPPSFTRLGSPFGSPRQTSPRQGNREDGKPVPDVFPWSMQHKRSPRSPSPNKVSLESLGIGSPPSSACGRQASPILSKRSVWSRLDSSTKEDYHVQTIDNDTNDDVMLTLKVPSKQQPDSSISWTNSPRSTATDSKPRLLRWSVQSNTQISGDRKSVV